MNSSTEKLNSSDAQLHAIEVAIEDINFIVGGFDWELNVNSTEESASEYDELDQIISDTDSPLIDDSAANSLQENSIDDPMEISSRFLKAKARRLVNNVSVLVRGSQRYRGCVPSALRAARAYYAKKYVSAIRHAYATYRCVKSKR